MNKELRMKLPQKIVFSLSALALSMSAMAAGEHAPKPDPLQGDGRVSAFYTWQDVIPSTPGKLLRSEPLEKTLSLPNAASAQRILYSSTDGIDNKTPIVVSGTLFLPKGKAPAAKAAPAKPAKGKTPAAKPAAAKAKPAAVKKAPAKPAKASTPAAKKTTSTKKK